MGIAIVGVLTMAFFANLVADRLNLTLVWPLYLVLLATVGIGWFIAKSGGLLSHGPGQLMTVGLLTCPMFFSGMIFSSMLKRGGDISEIMSANLMGAMCGGLLEYTAMSFGLGFLYLLAMVLYGAALILGLMPAAKGSVVQG